MINFIIPGQPVGKARPRVTKWGTYTPKKSKEYEKKVIACFYDAGGSNLGDEAVIEIDIKAIFAIPKNTSKKKKALMLEGEIRPCKKPDFDNIAKSVCDALNSHAYEDDKQIIKAAVEKAYGEEPRVEVTIKENPSLIKG